jgi:hypothetical protein
MSTAPTVTFYPVTDNGGSPQRGSAITVLDFGSVQAGRLSAAKAFQVCYAGEAGLVVENQKIWLNDTVATGGNTDVSQANGWDHFMSIDDSWFNPLASGITDAVKAGAANPLGNNFVRTPESEPASSNFVNASVSGALCYSDYVYTCVRPPSDAGAGVTENWGWRASFTYY